MSVNLTINGVSYPFPEPGDTGWGQDVTDWATAVSSSTLQRTGGTFTLTADADFGASFGLKAAYLKARTANPASAGLVRLAKTDAIEWRNNANGANLALAIDGSDRLTFGGAIVSTLAGALTGNRAIASDAAGALTASATTDTELGYVSGVTSALQAQLNAKVGAKSDTARIALTIAGGTSISADLVAGGITDTYLNASAAIARSKLAALTANRALVSNGSGFDAVSAVTATELGFVSGVTSAIQTQINALGSPGAKFLAAYSPSGAASVDITSVFSSTYKFYDIYYRLTVDTDDTEMWVRTDTSNGASFDAGAGNYSHQLSNAGTGGGSGSNNSASATKIVICGDTGAGNAIGNAAGEHVAGVIVVDTGSAGFFPTIKHENSFFNTSGTLQRSNGTGHRASAATIDSLQILPEGSALITGTVLVYGRSEA